MCIFSSIEDHKNVFSENDFETIIMELMFLIIFLISTGLFLISAVLQTIGYCKKINIMEYIAKPLMYASLISAAVFALIPRLPDSYNILICTCIALGLGMLAACLLLAPKRKRFLIASMLSFTLSSTGWLCLIWPSFKLFSPNPYITVVLLVIYTTLFVLFVLFEIGKKSPVKIAGIFVYLLPIMVFHYATILTLLGQPKLYSAILTAGSTCLLVSQAFIVKGFFKKASPSIRFARTIVFSISQLAITAGFIVMVTF